MADVIDDLDRSILQALQSDGRAPVAQIAERVGLSRPAVSERIEKLERAGVLRGTTAVVDPAALGNAVTAFVAVRRSSGEFDAKSLRAFRAILKRAEILEAHTVAGEDCYLLKVRTTDIRRYRQVLGEKISSLPHVASTSTAVAMESVKEGGI